MWILPSRKLRAECLNWEVACCCTKCTNPPYVTATVCKFEVFLGVVNAINVKLWKTAARSYYNYIVPYISYLTLIRFKVTVAWSSWNWDVPLVWVYVPCIYSQVRRELPWTIRVGMFIRRFFFECQLLPFVCWLCFSDSSHPIKIKTASWGKGLSLDQFQLVNITNRCRHTV